MSYLLKNAKVFKDGQIINADIFIHDGLIVSVTPHGSVISKNGDTVVFDFNNCYIFPGFIDVHVHLREPGFSYKETIKTGTMAAAHGGCTDVCTMPNLNPVPDSVENMRVQLDIIERDAAVNVHPYASITKGEQGKQLADMDELAKYSVAFSDDGRGVQDESMMLAAMRKAQKLGKIIAAHCEVNSLLDDGYIHKGEYARLHKHRGISSESEWVEINRDIELARLTGCKFHVCHVSAKESVELIRRGKESGVDVTCETAPHYLVFNDSMLEESGRFKMNPPIRSEDDRKALIDGILDGTIDMIATDHAPHSREEKSQGLEKSLMGVVGLETAFPVLYTKLVKENIITLEKLVQLMSVNPGKRFGMDNSIEVGAPANITVWNLDDKYSIDPNDFLSMGNCTPFGGMEVCGRCMMTMVKGEIKWNQN